MDDLNFYCNSHNSPIGGICSDIFCKDSPLMCIICAMDEASCIRKYNHELITFDEFFQQNGNYLNVPFSNKNLNILEFLSLIKKFNFELADKDYLDRKQERNEIVKNYILNLKNKIIEYGFTNKIRNLKELLKDPIKKVEEMNVLLDNMKSNGFDFIPIDNKIDYHQKFKNFSQKYSDIKLDKINLVDPLDIIGKIEDNNTLSTNTEDYNFLQKTIQQIKFLKANDNYKDIKIKFQTFNSILEYNKKNEKLNKVEDIKIFKKSLESLEYKIPEGVSRNILKNISIENNNSKESGQINKYIIKDIKIENKFSYKIKEYFNTCLKQPYSILEPNQLKFLYTIVKDFQNKNTLNDMITLFKTKDEIEYLAYSTNKDTINLINLTKEKLSENMNVISLAKINTGVIYKIEHYQNEEGKDFLITVSSDKTLNKYEYSTTEQKFKNVKSLKLKTVTYTFEIVELDNIPYIFVAPSNSKIFQYKFSDLSLIKNLEPAVNNYVYCIKSFYNKYLDKFFLVLAAHNTLQIYDAIAGTHFKTLKTDESNIFLAFVVLHRPDEKDYYIITNFKNYVALFSCNQGIFITKLLANHMASVRGLEIWNDSYVIAANDTRNLEFININGKIETLDNLLSHTKAVCGAKRFYHNEMGDILFSFSIDSTIKIWSY